MTKKRKVKKVAPKKVKRVLVPQWAGKFRSDLLYSITAIVIRELANLEKVKTDLAEGVRSLKRAAYEASGIFEDASQRVSCSVVDSALRRILTEVHGVEEEIVKRALRKR